MDWSKQSWDQIKNITADELIAALKKDQWYMDESRGAVLVFRHDDGRRVTVHYHPGKTYGSSLLKALVEAIGWTERDLRRLKLIR